MDRRSLLQQFVREECNDHVCRLLNEAFRHGSTNLGNTRFEFNRFEVQLDFDAQTATLEDVLDTSDAGMQKVPLSSFIAAVRNVPV